MNGLSAGRRRRILFTAILTLFNLGVIFSCYLGSVAWRCQRSSPQPSRWQGSAYEPDGEFGYFPVPNKVAYHALTDGDMVPVLFDDAGFRIPLQGDPSEAPAGARKILFLGCSFTHGYGVSAEETFAAIASRRLEARCLNAGVSGWGLAQMLLRARREIPRAKPTWVVVQYSNWLVSRSVRLYRPRTLGSSPTPYFFDKASAIDIHPPVFLPMALRDPDLTDHTSLAFAWRVGLPLFAHDDFHRTVTALRARLGKLPYPSDRLDDVVRFAYAELFDLCRAHGAGMLIVKIASGYSDNPYRHELPDIGCPIVDTYPALVGRLPTRSKEAWQEEYSFWRGTPRELVDTHPNKKAHQVIADVIVRALLPEETAGAL